MKTLIFNGSTRKKGDTQALIDAMLTALEGEFRIISITDKISPCLDCRKCWHTAGCSIKDDMQAIYHYLEECDNVVLASPIWFSSLSGPLLNFASRLQTYFAGRFFRKEAEFLKPKNGAILLVGAEPGSEKGAIENALTILKHVNARNKHVSIVCAMKTNLIPAAYDKAALAAAKESAEIFNQLFCNK